MKDAELISNAKTIANEERRLLARLLEYLKEIERRGLHLRMGYSSLFAFCRQELGYSEDEAQLRISVMRLSRDVPEVVQAVETGRLCLTSLAKAQTFFRQAKRPVPVEEKRQVLQELEGLSTRACLKRLAPPGWVEKKSFEVDDALLADLKRIRELWGNQDLSDMELLRKMAKLVLSRIDPELKPELKKSPGAHQVQAGLVQDEVTPPAELVTPEGRAIPAIVRREVWRRDQGRCTFTHGLRRCDSRYALQFDHLDPFGHGGAHTITNIRLLCRAHHRLKARTKK